MTQCATLAILLQLVGNVESFSSPIFTPAVAIRTPSKTQGVEIELPNFDELFGRISQVSPLARMVLQQKEGGFAAVDESQLIDKKWNTMEQDKQKKKPVHLVQKIDNFQNLGSPMLRFRSSLEGPCIGERFANFIMNFEERKRWDKQIDAVDELYPIYDTDAANMVMGFKYGECSRLGVGYCATKPNFVVSGREQLTLCGIQDFDNGSCVIWGTEMEDRHNHLLPNVPRRERARSHLFSTVIQPTGPNSFDVEYVLQLDCGGNIMPWMTTPVIVETVKSLFNHARKYFKGGEGSELAKFLEEQQQMDHTHSLFSDKQGLLLAP